MGDAAQAGAFSSSSLPLMSGGEASPAKKLRADCIKIGHCQGGRRRRWASLLVCIVAAAVVRALGRPGHDDRRGSARAGALRSLEGIKMERVLDASCRREIRGGARIL